MAKPWTWPFEVLADHLKLPHSKFLMAFETNTEIVKVRLPDGTELNFEVGQPGGERKVSKLEDVLDSSKIAKTIEGTVEILRGSFERIQTR